MPWQKLMTNGTGSHRASNTTASATKMDSLARMLSVLDLFTEERSTWGVDDIAARLRCSKPTAYRYLKLLTNSGLLAPEVGGVYGLGARIIQLDRQIRLTDPMLGRGTEIMQELSDRFRENLLLCGYYGDKLICTAQAWTQQMMLTSYARGRPMPLLRGAAGKVILAHLPTARLRSLMLRDPRVIAEAGLGETWPAFRETMRVIRREGHAVTYEEIDSTTAGIAAPILGERRQVLGSLVFAVPITRMQAERVKVLAEGVMEGARRLSAGPDGAPLQKASGKVIALRRPKQASGE
jgi:DNA-binding IclR family transcriptional regulator